MTLNLSPQVVSWCTLLIQRAEEHLPVTPVERLRLESLHRDLGRGTDVGVVTHPVDVL